MVRQEFKVQETTFVKKNGTLVLGPTYRGFGNCPFIITLSQMLKKTSKKLTNIHRTYKEIKSLEIN